MFFTKRKRNEAVLRLEIDLFWKCFLVLNGVFLLSLTQVAKIKNITSLGDILMIILAIIYFIAVIKMITLMTKKYGELFKILEK